LNSRSQTVGSIISEIVRQHRRAINIDGMRGVVKAEPVKKLLIADIINVRPNRPENLGQYVENARTGQLTIRRAWAFLDEIGSRGLMGKTITINSRLKWPDVKDNYVMMSDGHTIGRIRHTGTAWVWYIEIPMAMPDWASGTSGSLEDGQRAFASAWLRFLREHSTDRIKRALEFERAAEARLFPQTTAKNVESQITFKKAEPTRLPPTPAQVFHAARKVSTSKLLPPMSVRNPDVFYFPPAEEEL